MNKYGKTPVSCLFPQEKKSVPAAGPDCSGMTGEAALYTLSDTGLYEGDGPRLIAPGRCGCGL